MLPKTPSIDKRQTRRIFSRFLFPVYNLFTKNSAGFQPMGGVVLLLLGGISYTIGAVLYGVGVKKHWMHSVFHIFVVLGSLLQFLAIYLYAL